MKLLVLLFLFLTSCTTVQKKPLTEINIKNDKDIEKFQTKENTPKKNPVQAKIKHKKLKKKTEITKDKEDTSVKFLEVPFQVGEIFTYNAYFKGMHAAQIIFKVENFKEINSEEVFHFNIDVQSTGVISKFYYLKMDINSFSKRENFNSVKMTMASQENTTVKKFTNLFSDNSVLYISQSESDLEKDDKKVPSETKDPLTLIYYLRYLELGEKKEFTIIYGNDVKKINFSKIGSEKFSYKNQMFNSYIYEINIEGKKEKPLVWVENGISKRVFKFEIPISLGTIKVELE